MSNDEIITAWFDEYGDDIYHFFIYRIGRMDVEDLVQEVFIKAIKGFQHYCEKSSPKTWLFSIARNTAIDEIRKRQRSRRISMIPYEDHHDQKEQETPEDILQFNEETRSLYMAIQSLKSNYRDVVILRGIKELSVSETAEVLKWSESKVKSTYFRARLALQERLGGDSDE